eukprot:CAMPEP_0115004986 /NCGR_PEP_ID=MMETSP0216-20121206/19583_1 /TAXON_ID=223996 /ORGANISM="Protocruzia adherens, Strain Boccale" /LENGTH=430 /DNA_ID=CAMNT_0002371187 /DNA_START=138 /DNA_END=1430 /DNA_ORIENTATION=-
MTLKRSAALTSILDKYTSRNFLHIELGGVRSNHMSHGLIALGYLNASQGRLEKFGNFYCENESDGYKVEPPHRHDVTKIHNLEELLAFRGQRKNFLGIAEYFVEEINTEGSSARELVSKYAPYVIEGLSGRLLHALISLGYALEADHEDLIIDGLAYMFLAYRPVGEHLELNLDDLASALNSESEPFESRTVLELVQALKDGKRLEGVVDRWVNDKAYVGWGGSFQPRVAVIGDKAGHVLDELLAPLLKNPSLITPFIQDRDEGSEKYKAVLTELFDGIVWLYNEISEYNDESSFILLHGVTSCWSLARVLPLLTSEQRFEAIIYYIRTLLAVWGAKWETYDFKIGTHPLERKFHREFVKIPEFSVPVDHILHSEKEYDEHPTKLVFTCLDRLTSPYFLPVQSENFVTFLKVIAARQYDLLPWSQEPSTN